MSGTKHAFVVAPHTNGTSGFTKGAVILDMPVSQLNDLEAVGLLRGASKDEVAAARKAGSAVKADTLPPALPDPTTAE